MLWRAPDAERLDSLETCTADKNFGIKLIIRNCAYRWSITLQYDARYTQRHINSLQYDARYTQRHINTMQYDARYTQRHINTLQYDARYTQRHINTLQYDAQYTH